MEDFNVYFSNYLEKNGITKSFVALLLDMNYNTFISKLSRDGLSYKDIIFLDNYYRLGYINGLKEEFNREVG